MSDTVAAIDCGTNTIKLLIGALPEVAVRETRLVRLGQGVDATGRLADDALVRTFAALDEYAALIRAHAVTRLRFCATSATRDAENADVFTEGVRERLGVTPEVLSGAEEAELSYDGAVRNLRDAPALPVLVVDIGGGSTELIRGASLTAPPSAAHSMDIGSVRMHERHLRSDPPTMAEVAACVADIERHLDACPVSPARAATVVGVAGTVTSVAAGVLDLPAYDRDATDQAVLPVEQVHAMADRLVAADHRRAAGAAVAAPRPGRRDRRRCADPVAGAAPYAGRAPRRVRVRHPRRDRLVAGVGRSAAGTGTTHEEAAPPRRRRDRIRARSPRRPSALRADRRGRPQDRGQPEGPARGPQGPGRRRSAGHRGRRGGQGQGDVRGIHRGRQGAAATTRRSGCRPPRSAPP